MAEETKKPRPGAGLSPGFTISRAILSDAVALVRGDRQLSVECTREYTKERTNFLLTLNF